MADAFRMLVTMRTDEDECLTLLLPEPRSGKPQAYILAGGTTLQEVQRSKSFYSSWVVEDSLVSDGGLYLSTPIDPLFVLLPILEKSRNRPAGATEGGYFCALEQILDVPAHPHVRMLDAAAEPLLPCVCDVKEAGVCAYFRLNDDMVLAWLLVKVAQVRDAIEASLGGMAEEDQLAYVVGFLGDYLSEAWVAKLAQHLKVDLSAVTGGSTTVGSTRPAPASDAQAATPAADKKPKMDPKAAAQKKAKETRQANLAKLAQGTKSITSFFKPKS